MSEKMNLYNALIAAKLNGGGGDITSADVTAMTGYEKAETVADISTSDTLNVAMGKIEKRVEDISSLTTITQIAENTNLDNITTFGKYQCSTAAIAATLSGSPTTDAFILEVKQTASESRFIQEIIANKENEIYRRWYTALGFSVWYKYTGQATS